MYVFLEYPQQFTFRTYKYKNDSSRALGNQKRSAIYEFRLYTKW